MTNDLLKLKTSLADAIHQWIRDSSDSDGWSDLNTYIGDNTSELMADSAFNILLTQSDLSKYYKRNEMLKNE